MNEAETIQQLIQYNAADGNVVIAVNLANDTVWLSLNDLVQLFQRDQSVISRHLRNVFRDGELEEKSNMQKMHIANSDKPIIKYNLEVIISLGYRVKSKHRNQFRQWAHNDYGIKLVA